MSLNADGVVLKLANAQHRFPNVSVVGGYWLFLAKSLTALTGGSGLVACAVNHKGRLFQRVRLNWPAYSSDCEPLGWSGQLDCRDDASPTRLAAVAATLLAIG